MKGKNKALGIIVILVLFLVTALNSLLITNLSILDTDASTYVIVVMLMLFVFIVFASKENLDFEYSRKNIVYSAFVFVMYVLLLSYLRVALSSAFLTYRIDSLLFPLPLLAFILLVFGISGAKKLAPLIVYAAFASPLILLPILGLNGSFAGFNASLIYGFIRGIGIPVSKNGLIISSAVGSSITISTTCVSIGTFVAFVMFLIPLAYFYYGRPLRKAYWLLSGVALILALNFIRMLLISLVWVFYGLNSAINVFHAFAGQLIFYAAIITMVLLAYRYGLIVEKGKAKKVRTEPTKADYNGIALTILIGFLLAIAAFYLGSGYKHAIYGTPTQFSKSNMSGTALGRTILAGVENSRENVFILGSAPQGYLFLLNGSVSAPNSHTYVLANASYSPVPKGVPVGYAPIGSPRSLLLKDGITITSQEAESGNDIFSINYFSIPYNITGNWTMVTYILFRNITNGQLPECGLMAHNQTGVDQFESAIFNIIRSQSYSAKKGFMCQSYLIASS